MGLDMYLRKTTYIKNWDHYKKEERHSIKVLKDGKVVEHIIPERVSNVVEEVGYWRKANQIHQWFVQSVQDGKDDCGDYEVSREKLQELLDTVNKVLAASKLVDGKITNGYRLTEKGREPIIQDGKYIEDPSVAKELLPTSDGFFFGSTEYDQWYYDDLVNTKEILEKCLAEPEDYHISFEYHSSW